MKFKDAVILIEEDLGRVSKTRKGIIRMICLSPVLKFQILYRICSYLKQKSIICKILSVPIFVLYRHYRYKLGIEIQLGTNIRGGWKLAHFQSITINGGVVVGRNCTIYNDVTLGVSLYGQSKVPRIGDNVVICCGARILGDVSVGNDCIIGANAVVTHDIPDGCIAVGIPAKVIETNASQKSHLWLKKGVKDTSVY